MTRLCAVFPLLVFVAGCSNRGPTAPEASRASFTDTSGRAETLGNPTRPFGGRCDTVITVVAPIPGDPPNLQRLHIDYVCQLEHLGHTTASNDQIVIFTGATTAISSNTTTYTAANGDQLFSTWTGSATFDGPNVEFSGPETYSGGTGRFAHASGSSFISGRGSFTTGTASFTMTGTLTY